MTEEKLWIGLAADSFCRAFKTEKQANEWKEAYHKLSEALHMCGIDVSSFELNDALQEFFGMEYLDTADDDIEIKVQNI